jgi:hypothetical protein
MRIKHPAEVSYSIPHTYQHTYAKREKKEHAKREKKERDIKLARTLCIKLFQIFYRDFELVFSDFRPIYC